jgi:hypothetical protein
MLTAIRIPRRRFADPQSNLRVFNRFHHRHRGPVIIWLLSCSQKCVRRVAPSHCEARNLLAAISLVPILAGAVNARTLKSETVEAWDQYIQTASARMQRRLMPGASFLWVDESPDRLAGVRTGEILVSPTDPPAPRKVPSGLIHDWMGSVFLPNTTLDEVLSVIRDYPRYTEFYKPVVLAARTLAMAASEDRFSALLMNKSVLSRTALDGEYTSNIFSLDPQRAYSITQSTRIQETEDYGSPDRRTLPVDQGSGFIWRLFSIARYQERDGGVYLEVEAMALSRDVPFSLRWIVDPIVRRISRGSLFTSIKQTGDAVRSTSLLSHRDSTPANRDSGTPIKTEARSPAPKPQ